MVPVKCETYSLESEIWTKTHEFPIYISPNYFLSCYILTLLKDRTAYSLNVQNRHVMQVHVVPVKCEKDTSSLKPESLDEHS